MRIDSPRGWSRLLGLNKPVTIEVDRLEASEAGTEAPSGSRALFRLAATIGAPARGAADYQYYVLTVEDSAATHGAPLHPR